MIQPKVKKFLAIIAIISVVPISNIYPSNQSSNNHLRAMLVFGAAVSTYGAFSNYFGSSFSLPRQQKEPVENGPLESVDNNNAPANHLLKDRIINVNGLGHSINIGCDNDRRRTNALAFSVLACIFSYTAWCMSAITPTKNI